MRRIVMNRFSLILNIDEELKAFYSRLVEIDTVNKILELTDDFNQVKNI